MPKIGDNKLFKWPVFARCERHDEAQSCCPFLGHMNVSAQTLSSRFKRKKTEKEKTAQRVQFVSGRALQCNVVYAKRTDRLNGLSVFDDKWELMDIYYRISQDKQKIMYKKRSIIWSITDWAKLSLFKTIYFKTQCDPRQIRPKLSKTLIFEVCLGSYDTQTISKKFTAETIFQNVRRYHQLTNLQREIKNKDTRTNSLSFCLWSHCVIISS